MKKFICCFLSAMLLMGCSVYAFAVSDNQESVWNEEDYTLVKGEPIGTPADEDGVLIENHSVAMTLNNPAGAIELLAETGEGVGIPDELYQEYTKIAEDVGREYGLEISPCSAQEITTKYSVEEYESQVRQFCVEMEELQEGTKKGVGNSTRNPSSPGFGTKILTVNTTRTIDNGIFGWTIRGKAVVAGTNPYSYNGNVVIEELTCYMRPSNSYTMSNIGSSTQTIINSYTRKANQSVQIKKNGVAMTTITISARFVLNTSTGVVTMTAA